MQKSESLKIMATFYLFNGLNMKYSPWCECIVSPCEQFYLIPSLPNLRQGDRGAREQDYCCCSQLSGAGEPRGAGLCQSWHSFCSGRACCTGTRTDPQAPRRGTCRWLTWHSGEGWGEWIPSNTKTFRKKTSKHWRVLLESNKNTECEWKKGQK